MHNASRYPHGLSSISQIFSSGHGEEEKTKEESKHGARRPADSGGRIQTELVCCFISAYYLDWNISFSVDL